MLTYADVVQVRGIVRAQAWRAAAAHTLPRRAVDAAGQLQRQSEEKNKRRKNAAGELQRQSVCTVSIDGIEVAHFLFFLEGQARMRSVGGSAASR
jgi:hypothetical protein